VPGFLGLGARKGVLFFAGVGGSVVSGILWWGGHVSRQLWLNNFAGGHPLPFGGWTLPPLSCLNE